MAGFALGIFMMVTRTAPFAESGHASGTIFGYAGWVPIATVAGIIGGLAVGFVFACLMAVSEDWRRPYESRPSSAARLVPRILCGAVAGLVVGLLTGPGFIGVGVLGALCAWVLAIHDDRRRFAQPGSQQTHRGGRA